MGVARLVNNINLPVLDLLFRWIVKIKITPFTLLVPGNPLVDTGFADYLPGL